MRTFKNVEDYLEVMMGFRDPVTGIMDPSWLMVSTTAKISLARYDEGVVGNLSLLVANGDPLTQRQADLVQKIVLKYRRQFAALDIDVTPVENPVWRQPHRPMDYTCSVSLSDDRELMFVRFPYNENLINEFRRFTKECQGPGEWNREEKVWKIAVSEYNVSWVYSWAHHHKFAIDTEVCALFDIIQACEQQPYSIELTLVDGELVITNAADSLLTYITDHLGGLSLNNLERLIDNSSILDYTIDPDLAVAVKQNSGEVIYDLLANRELKIDNAEMSASLDSVLDYADQVGRWPVVFFEPDLFDNMLAKLKLRYPIEQIGTPYNIEMPITDKTRYIHAVKTIRNLEKIPLLVTSAGLLFGGERQMMLDRAEKIVYAAHDVYTKNHTGKKVKKIAG